MALFEAHGMHKRFGHQVVSENIDLRFESGRPRAVTGLHSLTRR